MVGCCCYLDQLSLAKEILILMGHPRKKKKRLNIWNEIIGFLRSRINFSENVPNYYHIFQSCFTGHYSNGESWLDGHFNTPAIWSYITVQAFRKLEGKWAGNDIIGIIISSQLNRSYRKKLFHGILFTMHKWLSLACSTKLYSKIAQNFTWIYELK